MKLPTKIRLRFMDVKNSTYTWSTDGLKNYCRKFWNSRSRSISRADSCRIHPRQDKLFFPLCTIASPPSESWCKSNTLIQCHVKISRHGFPRCYHRRSMIRRVTSGHEKWKSRTRNAWMALGANNSRKSDGKAETSSLVAPVPFISNIPRIDKHKIHNGISCEHSAPIVLLYLSSLPPSAYR